MGDGDRNERAWPEAAWRVCQCNSHRMDESVKKINMTVFILYYIGNLIGNSDLMKQKEGKLEVSGICRESSEKGIKCHYLHMVSF